MTRTLLILVAAAALLSAGCSTTMKPIRPSEPVAELGRIQGFRFDGDAIQIKEPGTPLSPSRAWQREVANYAARTLNTALMTPEDAPTARTTVTFDLGSEGTLSIGTWKSMDITLATVLPDGRVVKSQAVTGNIDDPWEYAGYTTLGVCGTALDVGAGVVALLIFIPVCGPNPFLAAFGLPILCGALVGGLTLNLAQSGAQYLRAASEETRWSNLFATALKQHAADILAGKAVLPPQPMPAFTPTAPTAPSTTTPPRPATPPAGDVPPPPLLDPAEAPPQPPPG